MKPPTRHQLEHAGQATLAATLALCGIAVVIILIAAMARLLLTTPPRGHDEPPTTTVTETTTETTVTVTCPPSPSADHAVGQTPCPGAPTP